MLKPAGLRIPKFIEPTSSLCEAFGKIAIPIRQKMEVHVTRIESLSTLRETLLPRLISGKLRLPDAEREIEAVTA
jgi:type I restriction enzyme S subunit